jgi:hypothetical protein
MELGTAVGLMVGEEPWTFRAGACYMFFFPAAASLPGSPQALIPWVHRQRLLGIGGKELSSQFIFGKSTPDAQRCNSSLDIDSYNRVESKLQQSGAAADGMAITIEANAQLIYTLNGERGGGLRRKHTNGQP